MLSNVSLAAERYFLLQPQARRQYLIAIYAGFFGIAIVMTVDFLIWPGSDGIHPSSSTGIILWMVLASIDFVCSTLLTTYFYVKTYQFTSHQLTNNPRVVAAFASDDELHRTTTFNPAYLHNICADVDKKVYIQCATLSASLIFCYFPFWVVNIITVSNGGVFPDDPNGISWSIALVLLSVDAIFTPVLVMYFKPEIRAKFLIANK
ncbi:hypothetical protein HK100_002308 [Physocladia obscura]|uniref:G protein-coupled receptor n=1 Tax=Physocladia obscura TaxID=109957 RepID=A0AAD5XB71_9FUNG|nr:hypothetical protein HK100_002308 [Physocladia obscura]